MLEVFHCAVLVLLVVSLLGVLANLACFEGLRAARPPADAPLVSILVPARNEARNIERCVRSLLAQDYPCFELLVLDDGSEDGTGDLVRALVPEGAVLEVRDGGTPSPTPGTGVLPGVCAPRALLMHGAALPGGWTGKNWACHQLVERARGEFLFFTDADTTHAPGTVSAAVGYAREKRAGLVSAWPRLVTVTWGERLIIPMIVLAGMVLYPHWLVLFLQERPRLAKRLPAWVCGALGAANGQFMFFTRAAYESIGGHAALRGHLVEDVALGRAVTARMGEGMRLFNCEALRFSTCRMYRSFREVWDGFTKNLRAAFGPHLAAFLAVGASQFALYLWPFIAVCFSARRLVLAEIAVIYFTRLALTWRFRTSWMSCLLHPIGFALALAIGLNSWRRSAWGGVSWKGRHYRLDALLAFCAISRTVCASCT